MTGYDPLNAEADPFHPPTIPTMVGCLHCGEEYDSYLIEWRVQKDGDGVVRGRWCCPTPECDGVGFGFDIFPCDREWRDENGELIWCDDEDDDDYEDELLDELDDDT